MGDAEGRVALVTGASRGIGAAIAIRLAAEGAAVALTAQAVREGDPRDPGSLTGVLARIADAGGTAIALAADLARPDGGREGLVAAVERRLGPLDILVNNAGMGGYMPFLDIADQRIDTVFEVNLRTPWELCRQALPGMRARRRGWIINIGSAAAEAPVGPPYGGTLPDLQGSLYGSSKAALHRLTMSLAAEAYADGIAVNVLAPDAAVRTRDDWPSSDASPEPVETVAEAALALATCSPDELTGRVAYSLSLLVELGRPVHGLDGVTEFAGWQPHEIPLSRLRHPPVA
ncbi:SDR family NAD(P)-dependent oxidoreductase [Frankia sp. AgB1.9]|uniref:SDR family NAD(P)-dependent oxidoreductase n=1 Tax=unclassified Frankia TaxID=2632575 RepID=UPI0019341C24|nr:MULTISPECIES: SDR family NAD(P)-dependent oxidoreductase [unclassified Frankia]MBL7490050.1 SDR family NAD(P)-dependent oxidoreductase [Frankia sp. AgW1.1]MBL7551333.1 SDR family NAD(P)-dependent oxidoreductase [Frankia sp. AgB1.9]MBL7624182.1 SDR family NAD(P)-dependent oxidoreductase [Frankia sp. AgB1.8]